MVNSRPQEPLNEMKVKFLINASGQFNLSYGPGDIAVLDDKQAELLIEAGACEVVEEPKQIEKPKTTKKK